MPISFATCSVSPKAEQVSHERFEGIKYIATDDLKVAVNAAVWRWSCASS